MAFELIEAGELVERANAYPKPEAAQTIFTHGSSPLPWHRPADA
ncbi:hypothetical protein [Solihabitans fulvus]|nr:hypothetical protein [Solihabitans fulvus]